MLGATTIGVVVGMQFNTCRTFVDLAAVLFDGLVLLT